MSVGGTAAYESETNLPALVSRAVELATSVGFEYSCLPAQGWFLQALTKGRPGARIGETGTGCGVGLAWMASVADETARIVSTEIDVERARAVAELFSDVPNVRVLSSSWRALEDYGPFDLLVLDGGGTGKQAEIDPERAEPAVLLAKGGILVIDDFTPSPEWPRRIGGEVDEVHDALRDIYRLIANALEIRIDLGHGENESQVNRHRLLHG